MMQSYYVPASVVNTLHILFNSHNNYVRMVSFYTHIVDEKTDAHRLVTLSQVTDLVNIRHGTLDQFAPKPMLVTLCCT